MDQSFDMPAAAPNPDVVRMHQAVNDQLIGSVANALQQAVADRQHANTVDINNVAARIRRSVRAQQSANQQAINGVVNSLKGTVAAAQSANDASLSTLPPSVLQAAVLSLQAGEAAGQKPGQTTPSSIRQTIAQQSHNLSSIPSSQQVPVASLVSQPVPVSYPCQQPVSSLTGLTGLGQSELSADGWYTVHFMDGSCGAYQVGNQCLVGGDPWMGAIGVTGLGGPYADEATARSLCTGVPVVTQPPPTVTQPPVTVTQPPIEPTPPAPTQPVTTAQYFCVKIPDGQGGYTYNVVQSDSILTLTAEGWNYIAGPFSDKEVAGATCAHQQSLIDKGPGCPSVTGVAVPLMPNWCDVNVCIGIDAITSQLQGDNAFDAFKALNAGTRTDPSPAGSWLDGIQSWPLIGPQLAGVITVGLCKITDLVNNAITDNPGASQQFVSVAVVRAVIDWAAKWFGLGLGDINTKLGYWLDYLSPTYIPNVGEADQLYLQGFITDQQWQCWVKANNICPDPHKLIVQSSVWHPGVNETERLYRAGQIDADEYNKLMRWNRVPDDYTLRMAQASYVQYPGFSDVIRFMVRDVFDDKVVQAGQYDLEFPEKYTAEAKAYGSIGGLSDDLAKLYWRAHWILPSVSQIYEMVHRLRPGRVDPSLVFTVPDARTLLGVNDNAPGYRDRLIAISYRPLPIRALRTLYDTDQIDTAEVAERYQDMGYSPKDGDLFGRQEEVLKARRIASQSKGWTPAVIQKAYAASAITDADVKQYMFQLGYDANAASDLMAVAKLDRQLAFGLAGERNALNRSRQAIVAAYLAGATGRDQSQSVLLSQGWSARAAAAILDAVDLQSRTKLVLQAVASIRRELLSGAISIQQAGAALAQAGIDSARATEYLATWTLQLSPKRRTVARGDVLKYVKDGIMSKDQAAQRLQNLGFPQDDVQLMLLEVSYQAQQSELRTKTALDKQRQKAAAALLRETTRLQALSDKTRKNLCKQTPPSVLKRWFAGHLIDDQYVVESLTCQGYTPDKIPLMLEEYKSARFERDQKKATIPQEANAATDGSGTGGTTLGS